MLCTAFGWAIFFLVFILLICSTLKMFIAQCLYDECRCLLKYDPVYSGRNEVSEKPGVSFSYLDNAFRRHSQECLKCGNISMCLCFCVHLQYLISATHQNRLIALLVTVSFSISCIIMLWKYAFVRKQVKDKSAYSQVVHWYRLQFPTLATRLRLIAVN